MTPTKASPFPKLSQVWRWIRVALLAFGSAALSGFLHAGGWPSRAALLSILAGAGEAAYRALFPTGKASGWLADLISAYRVLHSTAPLKMTSVAIGQPAQATAETPLPPMTSTSGSAPTATAGPAEQAAGPPPAV